MHLGLVKRTNYTFFDKKAMEKGFEKQQLQKTLLLTAGCVFFCIIMFGFGYFFGRLEQIEFNKSLLKVIPDVNCGVGRFTTRPYED